MYISALFPDFSATNLPTPEGWMVSCPWALGTVDRVREQLASYHCATRTLSSLININLEWILCLHLVNDL
ncbi:hypothetical protein Y032_0030g2157 [Ancylostoma ceylanicum]|uniref:Uncharacterized protein n=1 Tax=Ancylostoma ceylanicum TaxID=53326 RepID=A0A016URQ2_9BILA|nr:hypothetical protein Y032_0030g2157 [Ancylostoma ceylanicum]